MPIFVITRATQKLILLTDWDADSAEYSKTASPALSGAPFGTEAPMAGPPSFYAPPDAKSASDAGGHGQDRRVLTGASGEDPTERSLLGATSEGVDEH